MVVVDALVGTGGLHRRGHPGVAGEDVATRHVTVTDGVVFVHVEDLAKGALLDDALPAIVVGVFRGGPALDGSLEAVLLIPGEGAHRANTRGGDNDHVPVGVVAVIVRSRGGHRMGLGAVVLSERKAG